MTTNTLAAKLEAVLAKTTPRQSTMTVDCRLLKQIQAHLLLMELLSVTSEKPAVEDKQPETENA